jgi:hypothetical protein
VKLSDNPPSHSRTHSTGARFPRLPKNRLPEGK